MKTQKLSTRVAWRRIAEAFEKMVEEGRPASDKELAHYGLCGAVMRLYEAKKLTVKQYRDMRAEAMEHKPFDHYGMYLWPLDQDGARNRVVLATILAEIG